MYDVKVDFTLFVLIQSINRDKDNMPRIAGVNIPQDKRIIIALTYVYGIGRSLSDKILSQVKIDPNKRAKALSPQEVNTLNKAIEKYKVEGDLRREMMLNIKRLKEISSYRGTRHTRNLPVRGQQTRTNSRTVRGNVRRTVSSGRKRGLEKT